MELKLNIDREIVEALGSMPGLTSVEVRELLGATCSKAHVSNRLAHLVREGVLVSADDYVATARGPRRTYRYSLNPDPSTPQVCTLRKRVKRKAAQEPTQPALAYELERARERIRELEQWRADAIRRFPDLGVAPIILEARKIVAQLLRENGDLGLGDAVMSGQKDTILPMRATIAALEVSVD